MYALEISNDEINELPLLKYEGKIILISHENEIRQLFHDLRKEPFVGFDTETKPNFVKGNINDVALIQIATNSMVYLIRINSTGLSRDIIRFFESEIKKIGIALHDDIKALQRIQRFQPGAFINVNKITHEMGIKNQGMRKLAGIMLGGRVSKSQQLTNWENKTLTLAQMNYAATDAWICLKLYQQLIDRGFI